MNHDAHAELESRAADDRIAAGAAVAQRRTRIGQIAANAANSTKSSPAPAAAQADETLAANDADGRTSQGAQCRSTLQATQTVITHSNYPSEASSSLAMRW
jgi:hypothetical protein